MPQVLVNVVAVDEDAFPGFVNFNITDNFCVPHSFTEKIPVIGIGVEKVPYLAWIDCLVLEEREETVLISTNKPYGIESDKGQYELEVPIDSISIES